MEKNTNTTTSGRKFDKNNVRMGKNQTSSPLPQSANETLNELAKKSKVRKNNKSNFPDFPESHIP